MSWTRLEHMTGGTPLPGRAEAPAKYRLRTLGWRGPGRRKESWLRLEARPNTAPASAAGGEEARAAGEERYENRRSAPRRDVELCRLAQRARRQS